MALWGLACKRKGVIPNGNALGHLEHMCGRELSKESVYLTTFPLTDVSSDFEVYTPDVSFETPLPRPVIHLLAYAKPSVEFDHFVNDEDFSSFYCTSSSSSVHSIPDLFNEVTLDEWLQDSDRDPWRRWFADKHHPQRDLALKFWVANREPSGELSPENRKKFKDIIALDP
jgi:hypothetical protein